MHKLAIVSSLVILAAACGPSTPVIDAGPGVGLDVDSGTPDVQSGDGETCADAIVITESTQLDGDTTNADDDVLVSCGSGAANDLVYRIELSEDSGLKVTLAGYDAVLAIVDDTCTLDDEGTHEEGCVDTASLEGEEIEVGKLTAGTWYLIVDGYEESAGPFTLDVEIVPGGFCTGDAFDAEGADDNSTAATATAAGAADISTTDDPATTDVDETIDLLLCEGDTDTFLIGHMGGALDVVVTGADATLKAATVTVDVESFAVAATGAGADQAMTGDAPRGYYLLTTTKSGAGQLGTPYSFAITHGCQPDFNDDPAEELDRAYDGTSGPGIMEPLQEADARTVCGGDEDHFRLNNVVAGDVTITLTDGADLGVELARIDGPADAETEVALAAPGDYTVSSASGTLVVTIPAAAASKYALTVNANGADTDVEYAFNVTYAGIADPPANDLCAGHEALTAGETPTATFGRTLGGANDLVSACNGDDAAAEGGYDGAPDVFYSFHLDALTDVGITFDGTGTEFQGAVSLYLLPGTCPTNLAQLVPVQVNGAPLCKTGDDFELRAPDLGAGDYLVAVDGTFFDLFGLFQITTKGTFDVAVKTYPAGFPPAAACTAAETLTVPAIGSSTTDTIAYATDASPNEFDAYSEACSPSRGGTGNEKIYALTPTANVKIDVTTDGYDTVVALLANTCDPFTAPAQCNDDIDVDNSDYNSHITATLTANTTYYLVIDAWGDVAPDAEVTSTTVTIASSAP